MRDINYFLAKASTVNVQMKHEQKELLSKGEIQSFIVRMYGQEFKTRSSAKKLSKLSYLMGVNSSSKVEKGLMVDMNTAILYLQPYKTAFGNTCAVGEHCIDACLSTSGRVKMDIREFKILRARYLKTILFYVNRDFFNDWLHAEIEAAAKKHGDTLVVRLNGTSDLSPVLFGNVLAKFPSVQFYDYTKILNRSKLADENENYHVTFSYNGYNMKDCEHALKLGLNVALCIQAKQPKRFEGVEVFSMDETDRRPFDTQKSQFGYLKLKETLASNYDSSFVIKANDNRLEY